MTDAARQVSNSVDFDETTLADASVSGDTGAFEILYAHYFPRVKAFCIKKMGDRELAEDVAQEAFARAFERIGTFGGPRHFGGWVSTIAANLCTDNLRRRKYTPISLEQVDKGPSYEFDPIRNLQREDNRRLVQTALEGLEPRHREALMLHTVGGASCAAVGAHLGISEVAAESLLARARRRLRKEITDRAAPADLFGVTGFGIPAVYAVWRRLRAAAGRRLMSAQLASARGWEAFSAPVTAAVDGGRALVVAMGAGLVIGVAGAAAPPVHKADAPQPSSSVPALVSTDAGSTKDVKKSGSGASKAPVTAKIGTADGKAAVDGSARVEAPAVPGGEGQASGDLDLGIVTDLANPAQTGAGSRIEVRDLNGEQLLDSEERAVNAK